MIPGLVMLFGQDRHAGFNQHLYQAAAMIVNVCVVVPALVRHARAKAVVPGALLMILPGALAFIFVGVWASNLPIFSADARFAGASGPVWLGRVFAVFLMYVVYVNVRRLIDGRRESLGTSHLTWPRGGFIGTVMGFIAGLMGIGGGAVAVPLQQTLLRLPLRNCIANSTAIIGITAGFGALAKNLTLAQHGLSWRHSLLVAALLAPTAVIGGWMGGSLTHILPMRIVRGAFILLMIIAAWRMLGL
jgi:hypothetical protein